MHNAEHSPSSAIRCNETLSSFDSKQCSMPALKANSKSTLVFLLSVPRAFDSTFRVSFDCSAVKIFSLCHFVIIMDVREGASGASADVPGRWSGHTVLF